MSAERNDWPHVRELFEAALLLPTEARAEFLTKACADDLALRERVQRLLDSHEHAGVFLEGDIVPASPGRSGLDLAGKKVGSYEVLARLGAGGMGEVYRARDARLHRDVALKFLRPETADRDQRARIHHEARAAARLDHPFICKVYEVADADTGTYIAMEYVAGQTLAERLRTGPLPLGLALSVAVEIAEALSAAHRGGVVHRDLKPANIMLGDDGHAKVLDFGLASRIGRDELDSTAPTLANSTGGTLAYMSPEQLRGEPASERSDIFGLGLLVAEMVTAVHPFARRTSILTASAILYEEPAEWPAASSAPALLQHIVRKALAKTPSDRYSSAHDLLTDLRAVQAGSAQAPSKPQASVPAAKRVSWTGLIAAAILTLAVVAGLAWRATRGEAPAAVDPVFLQVTSSGNVISTALSPDGLSVAYITEAEGTRQLMLRDVSGGPAVQLASSPWLDYLNWLPDGTRLHYRDREGASEISRMGGEPRKSFPFRPAAWSADGTRVATASMARPLFRIYSADGQPLAEAVNVAGARRLGGIDWHRGTDTLLLFGLDDQDRATIWTTSLDGKDLKPVYVSSDHVVVARWSPLASTIYFLRARAETADLVSIDVARTDSLRVLATGLPNGNQLSVSTDGRRLLHLRGITRSNLALIDAGGTDSAPRPITRGTAVFDDPAVSPDGRWIAAVAGEGAVTSIVKIPRDGGNPVRLTDGQGRDRSPAWSPDGRHLAFGSRRNGENTVWVMDDDGRNVRKLEGTNAGETLAVAWTPDGRVMWQQNTAAKGITYRVRDLSTGREEFLVQDSEGFFVSRPVFSPTADAVAFRWGRVPATQSGIWLLSWPQRSERRLTKTDAWPLGWSPDGRFVYALPLPGGSQRPGIYRASITTGELELVATVPTGTIVSGAVVRGDTSIVASIRETSGDAWMIDLGRK